MTRLIEVNDLDNYPSPCCLLLLLVPKDSLESRALVTKINLCMLETKFEYVNCLCVRAHG